DRKEHPGLHRQIDIGERLHLLLAEKVALSDVFHLYDRHFASQTGDETAISIAAGRTVPMTKSSRNRRHFLSLVALGLAAPRLAWSAEESGLARELVARADAIRFPQESFQTDIT